MGDPLIFVITNCVAHVSVGYISMYSLDLDLKELLLPSSWDTYGIPAYFSFLQINRVFTKIIEF